MQYGPETISHFLTIGLNKNNNKNEPVGVFQFCFQFWNAQRQLFDIFLGFFSAVSINI